MGLNCFLSCDGPGCRVVKRNLHPCVIPGNRIGVNPLGRWIHDPGWGYWCSIECHDAWIAKHHGGVGVSWPFGFVDMPNGYEIIQVSFGTGYRIRAFTVFQKEQPELDL